MSTFYIVAFIILIIVAFCTGLIVGFAFWGSYDYVENSMFNPLNNELLTSEKCSCPRDLYGNIIYESE